MATKSGMSQRSGSSSVSHKSGGSATSKRSGVLSTKSSPSVYGLGAGLPIPCATMLIVALCIFIHLEILDIPFLYVKSACSGLYQVFYLQEYSRILLCHLVHADTWELSFQMLSLLWKGHQLEKCCGPVYFIIMLLVFAPLCSISLFVVHKLLADFLDPIFITQCFCGFGSINFTLKVIKMYQSPDPGVQCIMGSYCFKLKYFSWAEIVISHLISSTATIAANLAGVAVGLLYISGILQFIIGSIVNLTKVGTVSTGGFSLKFVKSLIATIMKRSSCHGFGGALSSTPSSRKSEPALGTAAEGTASENSIISS